MTSKRIVGVIPVRLESTRLARKPLFDRSVRYDEGWS